MPLIFVELERSEKITKEQFLITLKYYAEDGRGISARVVREQIRRIADQLTVEDRKEIERLAVVGASIQEKMHQTKEVGSYKEVAACVLS